MTLAPLVGSGREAEAVASILTATPRVREGATEAALKQLLPEARFVHVAAHAFIHPKDPKLSALFLKGGGGEDGVFELRELGELSPLNSEIVVLSACESGLGELVRGEGFLGFGRAFFQAGVRSLVASLWQVHDRSAATLMPFFWRFFTQGRSPSRALREAKLAYLEAARSGGVSVGDGAERGIRKVKRTKIKPDHPYFWAGFVVLDGGRQRDAAPGAR